MWSSWCLCGIPSNRILTDSSASKIQAHLVLLFPILLQVSPQQLTGVLQGIAAGIGISDFLRAFLMVCLSSSSSGSMKKIPRILLAFSSFGLSMIHFCFALPFDASDICFHISGHHWSGVVFNHWSSSFPRERTAGVSSRSITVTKKFNSLTYSVVSSLVCTSPVAVITVVALLDVLMVSNSAELRSFLLTMCIVAPGIHYKLSFLRLLLTELGVPILPRASRM